MPEVKKKKPCKSAKARQAEGLRRQGFDKSVVDDGSVLVQCSQCEAAVINGAACHELGCPNQRRGT